MNQHHDTHHTVEELRRRANRARALLTAREAEHQAVATEALNRLREARGTGVDVDEQTLAAAAAARSTGRVNRQAEEAVLAEPVTEQQIDAAPTDRIRQLLIQTAAAQQAITKLRDTHADTARDAVGMWQEYQQVHGYDPDTAEAQAWLETSEGVHAVYDNAHNDLDYRALQRQHHQPDWPAGAPQRQPNGESAPAAQLVAVDPNPVTAGRPPETIAEPTRPRADARESADELDNGRQVDDVDRVRAHLQARTYSHPDTPATGLYDMSPQRWRECVDQLRGEGHVIDECIVATGERASNDTGYLWRGKLDTVAQDNRPVPTIDTSGPARPHATGPGQPEARGDQEVDEADSLPKVNDAAQLVDPATVAGIAREATAHNYGQTVYDVTASSAGVRMRFSSWPRQQEATRRLRELGYNVQEFDDATAVVTGRDAHDNAKTDAGTRPGDDVTSGGVGDEAGADEAYDDELDDGEAETQTHAAARSAGPLHLHLTPEDLRALERWDQLHGGQAGVSLDHTNAGESDDPVADARAAVDDITAQQRDQQRRREAEHARAEQLDRWHHDDEREPRTGGRAIDGLGG